MNRVSIIRFFFVALFLSAQQATAGTSTLAYLTGEGAVIEDKGGVVQISVPISETVPWKLHTLANPARLVIDFAEVQWIDQPRIESATVSDIRVGRYRPGWSRLVAVLREPLEVANAEMTTLTSGEAHLLVTLRPTTADAFRSSAGTEPATASEPPPVPDDSGKLRIALDPGHGGIDPGAQSGDLVEADLMLSFARTLKETLVRSDRFDVIMTRNENVFVSLEDRLTIARAAGAHVFLSLHADALEADSGRASGLTVYTLADDESDVAARQLAERHAQNDILSGVDLSGSEDEIAIVLMDLARRDTAPRTDALAGMIVSAMYSSGLPTNSRPKRHGRFSVLKSAEIPSLLIELGYLSDSEDRSRLTSPDWQLEASLALRDGLLRWWDEDLLLRNRFRR